MWSSYNTDGTFGFSTSNSSYQINVSSVWTHISFHKTIEAVVYPVDGVPTIDAVTHEGAYSGIHTARRGAYVHHSKVVATLLRANNSQKVKCTNLLHKTNEIMTTTCICTIRRTYSSLKKFNYFIHNNNI